MGYHFRACVSLCAVFAAGCGDSPTGPSTGSVYVLDSVNGLPVPAALDSATVGESRILYRIVGRSVEIVSRDSALYAWATDAVERAEDGTLERRSFDCEARQVAWTQEGDRLILSAAAVQHPPSTGFPNRPAINDTLQMRSGSLLHQVHEPPSVTYPDRRVLEFEYRTGELDVPICT